MTRWEYAFVHWQGDARGARRSIDFSHRPRQDKIDGTLTDHVKQLGDEGWEMVGVSDFHAMGTTGSAGPIYAFKRPLT